MSFDEVMVRQTAWMFDRALADARKPPAWPKLCSCGEVYLPSDWEALPLAGDGVWHTDDGDLEIRNCKTCRSTLAMERP